MEKKMPRPKGSKNKPKTDGVIKPSKALKNIVAKEPNIKLAPEIKKAIKTSKPMPVVKVNAPVLEPEKPAATSPKVKAVRGKNEGEAIIRPVDDDQNSGEDNTIVMHGGKATLRKSSSNPDLD